MFQEGSINSSFVHWKYEDPPAFHPFFWFERMDYDSWKEYASVNWKYSYYASAIYLITIFALKHVMKNRPPFKLQWLLAIWNLCLGAFSVMGCFRTGQELIHVLQMPNGLHKSICTRVGLNPPASSFSVLFALSKFIELGDTLFIVLRKQPLLFIQWYHHAVSLILAWQGSKKPKAPPPMKEAAAVPKSKGQGDTGHHREHQLTQAHQQHKKQRPKRLSQDTTKTEDGTEKSSKRQHRHKPEDGGGDESADGSRRQHSEGSENRKRRRTPEDKDSIMGDRKEERRRRRLSRDQSKDGSKRSGGPDGERRHHRRHKQESDRQELDNISLSNDRQRRAYRRSMKHQKLLNQAVNEFSEVARRKSEML